MIYIILYDTWVSFCIDMTFTDDTIWIIKWQFLLLLLSVRQLSVYARHTPFRFVSYNAALIHVLLATTVLCRVGVLVCVFRKGCWWKRFCISFLLGGILITSLFVRLTVLLFLSVYLLVRKWPGVALFINLLTCACKKITALSSVYLLWVHIPFIQSNFLSAVELMWQTQLKNTDITSGEVGWFYAGTCSSENPEVRNREL